MLRATPLPNGDLVLCAPRNPSGGRTDGEIWLMPRPLGKHAPVPLGESCWEGTAVSKESGSTAIAWVRSDFDFSAPDRDPFTAQSQLLTGRIVHERQGEAGRRTPELVDRTLLADRHEVHCPIALLEAQDFRTLPGRPGVDHEVLFTVYGYGGGFEVVGIDRETREITNYSRSPLSDEAEGMAPNGEWITVERPPRTSDDIDIWRVWLDGEATWERLTFFNEFPGFGANSSVVSPDLRWMAFTLDEAGQEPGSGESLLLFDLEAWDESSEGERVIETDRRPPHSPPEC